MKDASSKKPLLLISALALGLIAGALLMGSLRLSSLFGGGPDPETVATASLESMREQARLTPFAARFVAVVTSTQSRFGLNASKTLIMPGMVRYEVDLAKLQQRDIAWDEGAKKLSVTLPPLEISRPEINLSELQEYDSGGVLMALTSAEDRIDAANRQRGQQELVRQARAGLPMRLARDAAKRAVERSFAMPLRAAGIEAQVEVRFADEARQDPSYLDRSRRPEDVLKERATR
jgi:ABC-type amino acid transport substrate-binding protein